MKSLHPLGFGLDASPYVKALSVNQLRAFLAAHLSSEGGRFPTTPEMSQVSKTVMCPRRVFPNRASHRCRRSAFAHTYRGITRYTELLSIACAAEVGSSNPEATPRRSATVHVRPLTRCVKAGLVVTATTMFSEQQNNGGVGKC